MTDFRGIGSVNPERGSARDLPPPPPVVKKDSKQEAGRSTTFESKFSIGDRVSIDGDTSLKAVVTAVCFRLYGGKPAPVIEVSWIAQGASYCAWIEEFRLQETV